MPDPISTVEYRDVPGFPGYRVGSDGSVWSCHRRNRYRLDLSAPWRRLAEIGKRPGADRRSAYRRVKLCCGRTGRWVRRFVHQLVLEAFVGPCPPGMQGCHDPNPDPSDNRLSNLRWDTPKANAADAMKAGGYDAIRGVRHYRAKLDEAGVRAIRAARAAGEPCGTIAARFGISSVMVSLIARRKAWAWLP